MEDSQNLLTIIEFTDTVTESFPIEDYILEVDPVDLITEDVQSSNINAALELLKF
jgi:hypothetical protein